MLSGCRPGLPYAIRRSESLVEVERVDAGAVVLARVLPRPSAADRRIRERHPVPLITPPVIATTPCALQRVRHVVQRLHRRAAHVVADRRIAAPVHDQRALQRVVHHAPARGEVGAERVVRPELHERRRARHDLHVRRGHEQLARIQRIQRVAVRRDPRSARRSARRGTRAVRTIESISRRNAARELARRCRRRGAVRAPPVVHAAASTAGITMRATSHVRITSRSTRSASVVSHVVIREQHHRNVRAHCLVVRGDRDVAGAPLRARLVQRLLPRFTAKDLDLRQR